VCEKNHDDGKKGRKASVLSDDAKTQANKLNTEVDMGSSRPNLHSGKGGETAPARAYYIGPWGDQMSVFAAKMDRQIDENETRLTAGPMDEGSGVSAVSSQRSLTDKNANGSIPD